MRHSSAILRRHIVATMAPATEVPALDEPVIGQSPLATAEELA